MGLTERLQALWSAATAAKADSSALWSPRLKPWVSAKYHQNFVNKL